MKAAKYIVTDVTPAGKEVYLTNVGSDVWPRIQWCATERMAKRFAKAQAEQQAKIKGGHVSPVTK